MDQAIVDKIEKLLALATSSNEHEANLAAQKASELLTMYNLTIEQIEERKTSDYVENTMDIGFADKLQVQDKYVRGILQQYFFVRVFSDSKAFLNSRIKTLVIIGTKTNVKVASLVFEFLNRAFPLSWGYYKIDNNASVSSRTAFYEGMYSGLCEQLSNTIEKIENSTGLVVRRRDQKLWDFVDEKYDLRTKNFSTGRNNNDAQAKDAGYETGLKTKIVKGITATKVNNKNMIGG